MEAITGQKVAATKAKNSIANSRSEKVWHRM